MITFPRLAMNSIKKKKTPGDKKYILTVANCNKKRMEEFRELGGEKKLLEVFICASD